MRHAGRTLPKSAYDSDMYNRAFPVGNALFFFAWIMMSLLCLPRGKLPLAFLAVPASENRRIECPCQTVDDFIGIRGSVGTNWQDMLFGNTGIKQNYNLNISGGSKDLLNQWVDELNHFLEIREEPPEYETKTGRKKKRFIDESLSINNNVTTGKPKPRRA